ncbi:hypothetical protein M422DRAFT_242423 [Sphaerobolus stellatus SS14]|nr:hypothetical protein M422DRAFT_242423 [Sphaerobolus stellatus SS14]
MPVEVVNASRTGRDVGPEDIKLCLPSDFPASDHAKLGIVDHALIERELRVGQAHDALKKLRTLLGLKSFLVRRRRLNPGYSVATRAESEIKKVEGYVKRWRKVYEWVWNALEALRGDKEIPREHLAWRVLAPLTSKDCIMLSEWMADHAYWKGMGERKSAKAAVEGEGPKALSWIWKVELDLEGESMQGVEGAVEDWTNEAIRLEWVHAKGSGERWEEETKLLKAEGKRVGNSFAWLRKEWEDRAQLWANSEEIPKGALAYAARSAKTMGVLEKKAFDNYIELLALA